MDRFLDHFSLLAWTEDVWYVLHHSQQSIILSLIMDQLCKVLKHPNSRKFRLSAVLSNVSYVHYLWNILYKIIKILKTSVPNALILLIFSLEAILSEKIQKIVFQNPNGPFAYSLTERWRHLSVTWVVALLSAATTRSQDCCRWLTFPRVV